MKPRGTKNAFSTEVINEMSLRLPSLSVNEGMARAAVAAFCAQLDPVSTDIADIKHRRNDPEYKKDRDLIRKRLRLSAQYMAVADLGSALEQCDLVLRSDPYNQQAIALRSRIQRKRQMIIDKEREATRNGMIADVGAAWRPVYAVDSVEFKNVDGGTMKTPIGVDPERSIEQSIEKRMKEMMLPSISFRPSQRSRFHDKKARRWKAA